MVQSIFDAMSASMGLWSTVLLFIGLGVAGLNYGADWLVNGASNLGFRLGISATMIGLTIVAFGTSAPELVVSLLTSMQGKPELCLGNVVGSNIANTALILGATALIFPLNIGRNSVRYDAPLSAMAIGTLFLLAVIGATISRLDGFLLLAVFAIWMTWLIRKTLRESANVRRERRELKEARENGTLPESDDDDAEPHFHPRSPVIDLVLIVVGLVVLVISADGLVAGAVATAQALAVPDIVVGLTIIAGGTSLPELAVGMVAAFKHKADITVGNVMGSNIFNALLIIGTCTVLAPISFDISEFTWSGDAATLFVDIPFCVFVCLLVIPMMRHGAKLTRFKGAILLSLYLGYLVALVLRNLP